MTKQEFSKTVKIYSSHKIAGGNISITYANIISRNTLSTQEVIQTSNSGGALTSLFDVSVNGQQSWSVIKDFNTGKVIG